MNQPETFGRYTLLRKLATGGMAEVFLARAQGPGGFEKMVVLKKILPELARDETFTKMFLTEARLAAAFSHPNVAQVFDFGEVDGRYYLTMEWVDGPTLRQVKKRAISHHLLLPFDVVAGIMARACEGLHYVHELKAPDTQQPLELVHRDISPDNLILSRNGQVKVLDFGIVKSTSPEAYTKSGSVRGKLAYMPPEQISAEPLDRRVDVWALGMVLYELLTLHRPFEAQQEAAVMKAILFEPFTPLERFRDVPPGLVELIDTCLQKDRSRRFATARELQGALEQFVSSCGHRIGSYEIENFVRELSEGRAPRQGAATLPLGAKALPERPPMAATVDENEAPPAPATRNLRVGGVSETLTDEGAGATATNVTLTTPDPRPSRSTIPVLLALAALTLGGLALWKVLPTGVAHLAEPGERDAALEVAPAEPPAPDAGLETGLTEVPAARPPVVDAPQQPDAALTVPIAPIDAGRAAPVPDAGLRKRSTPPSAPPSSRPTVTVEFRLLPEGTVMVDGVPFTSGVLDTGAHQARFISKRFGELDRPVELPPCTGKVLVGFSFSSDKLSVTCKP